MYNPQRHHRRSIRLPGYDYREDGAYFITLCTADRACVFGEVRDGIVSLTRRGIIAQACWYDIPHHRPNVQLDEFIVMPNHTHGILWIDNAGTGRGDACVALPLEKKSQLYAGSLGAIVGSYKAAVSREINRLRPGAAANLWQPNYYEHVIRNDQALEAIREYVRTNAERWGSDSENPAGDGTDDFEKFVRQLVERERLERLRAAGRIVRARLVPPGTSHQSVGGASVAPTGALTVGAGQGDASVAPTGAVTVGPGHGDASVAATDG